MVNKKLLIYQTLNLFGLAFLLLRTDLSIYIIFGIWFFYSVMTFINGFWDGFNQGMMVCIDIFSATDTEELLKVKKNTKEFMKESWIYYLMVPFKASAYWTKKKLINKSS